MRVALILFLSLASCISWAGDISRFCVQLGNIKEVVCHVPMSTLLARGEDFDGKLVTVTGYYVYSSMSMLFSSKTAFLSSDSANGLAITMPKDPKIAAQLKGLNHREVLLMGRFSMKPVDVTRYNGDITGGRLFDITQVGDAFSPWGFSEHAPPLSKEE